MQKSFERIKDGSSCGLGEQETTLIKAIDEIITCELSWGATVEFGNNIAYFRTKVFGDVDHTKFTGTVEEIRFIKELVTAWSDGRRCGVNKFLLKTIGIDCGNNTFKMEDVLALFDLHLSGFKPDELIPLLTPITVKESPAKALPVSSELIKIADSLDSDDAVRHMVKGFQMVKILDEAHHPR